MKDTSKEKRIAWIALITILSVVVYGCVFPILNFSLEKPKIPVIVVLLNVAVFYFVSDGMGTVVPKMFPRWTLFKIGCYNFAVSSAGLIARYLLEFGEISNTYNFTVFNVAFYLLMTVGLATLEANKTMSKDK